MHDLEFARWHFIRRPLIAAGIAAAIAALPYPVRASASLTAQTLGSVEVAPPKGAKLPLSLQVTQDGRALTMAQALSGRPAVLIFVDYTCRTLCGPIVSFAAHGLAQSGLRPND